MNGAVIKTEFLRELLSKIPKEYSKDLIYDDSQLFAFANFTGVSDFSYIYNLFRKDKYDLKAKYKENFNAFFVECAINLCQKNDYKRLVFLYGILASSILESYLEPHILALKEKEESIDKIYNNLDYYYASVKLKHDLTKEALYDLYPDGFYYFDYVEDLIHYPLIRAYKFMGSRGYYRKSYSRFEFYAKYNSKGSWHKPFFVIWNKLFARKKLGKQYFLYEASLNESILNSQKKDYRTETGMFNYSFEDIWKNALNDAAKKIEALNVFLFKHEDKKFRKEFQIPDEKKI